MNTGIKRQFDKQESIYIWMKLKYYVDSDYIIWQKVTKKLTNGVRSYRTYYVKPKVRFILLTVCKTLFLGFSFVFTLKHTSLIVKKWHD